MDDRDIAKIVEALNSSLDDKFDRKFKEFEEKLDLKLEAKGKIWARKTIEETLNTMGVDTNHPFDMQRDMNFLRGARLGSEDVKKRVIFKIADYGIVAMLAWIAVRFKDMI